MTKKVIQVPIDENLLKELNYTSRKQRKARAEFIREACQLYLRQIREEELNDLYKRGYQRIPEKAEVGQAQIAMTSEIMRQESW